MFHEDFTNLEKCILKILQRIQKGAKWGLLGIYFTMFNSHRPVDNTHFRGVSQSEEHNCSSFRGEISGP